MNAWSDENRGKPSPASADALKQLDVAARSLDGVSFAGADAVEVEVAACGVLTILDDILRGLSNTNTYSVELKELGNLVTTCKALRARSPAQSPSQQPLVELFIENLDH
eukprot:5726530-Pyramimonas_sp.AAC.1